ncbi:MAG: tyrosine-type recombinase/integrase [Asgard group archaeon]
MKRNNKRDKKGRFTEKEPAYKQLLKNEAIKDWIRQFSERTVNNYLYHINYFLERRNLTIEDLLNLEAEVLKQEIFEFYLEKKKEDAEGSVYNTVTSIKSFRKYHGKTLPLMKEEKERYRVTYKRAGLRHVPSKEEVYVMVENSKNLRDKAIILTLFQSGIRSNALVKLTVGMVRECLFPEIITPIPLKITRAIDTKLSSYALGYYYTFLGYESAEMIKLYLEKRARKRERLNDNSLLFVLRNGKPLNAQRVYEIVQTAGKLIGHEYISPHCLRKSFRKMLNSTPLSEDFKEAVMGHKLPNSRGNYFDFQDLEKLKEWYMSVPWGKEAVGRLNNLEKVVEDQAKVINFQRQEIEVLKRKTALIDQIGDVEDFMEKVGILHKLIEETPLKEVLMKDEIGQITEKLVEQKKRKSIKFE